MSLQDRCARMSAEELRDKFAEWDLVSARYGSLVAHHWVKALKAEMRQRGMDPRG